MKQHHYKAKVEWTGNIGEGTLNYEAYSRNHEILAGGKNTVIYGSSDPAFHGDISKYNPEDLFLSSLSACHMLWYLHLCSEHKIVVIAYTDNASGIMEVSNNGSGKFIEVTLNPKVIVTDVSMISKAIALHEKANEMCFIANSCNFKISHQPDISVE